MLTNFKDKIFTITNEEEFNKLVLEVMIYQYDNNPLYKAFAMMNCDDLEQIRHYTQIPFLPIEFFKTHNIISGAAPVEASFCSSGTTGQARSLSSCN